MSQPLQDLIQQAQELITQIQEHPQFKELEYSPDLNVFDAQQALLELEWELESCPQSQQ